MNPLIFGLIFAILGAILLHLVLLIGITYNTLENAKYPQKMTVVDPIYTQPTPHPVIEGSLEWEDKQKIIEKYK